MSKKIILGIIVLMALALIGLIALQIYWVGNAISLKEQEFNAEVHGALSEMANQYEDMTIRRQLKNRINIIDENGKKLLVVGNDTVEMPTSKNMNFNVDLLMNNPQLTRYWLTPTNMEESFDELSKFHQLNRELSEQFRNKGDEAWVGKHIKMIIGELSILNEPSQSRIDLEYINKEFGEKLKKRGINLDYDIGIVQPALDTVITNDENAKKELITTEYKADLFPHRIIHSSTLLSVHFPKKISFLLQTLVFRMLSSIVFILIIIFSFGFTIYTIYRQKKLSEMKNDFINNMTHEFKTPITTISLAGQALSDHSIASDESRVERFSRMIIDETSKLGTQVEKILQMAILDKGELKMKIKEVDMHQIIERVVDNHKLRLKDDRAYIIARLDAEHSNIMGDEMHLSNLIDNLIDNAVKYCIEYPEVRITTKTGTGGIIIYAEDHGIGMAQDTQKKIFEKFYRVPTGNIHNVKGFGLGLAYVKTIVDAHGGKITVNSELNKGTKFKIHLPYNNFEK